MKRLRLSALLVLGGAGIVAVAGGFVSVAAADDPPPGSSGGGPSPVPLPVPMPLPPWPPDSGQRFDLSAWRSDRIDGVVRETIRFTFCSSRSTGPFRVIVTESRGWDRHARPVGPRYVESERFRLWFDKRYPFDVPQCRQVTYSWHPKRVMFLPGARALDVTIAYPRAAWVSPGWPLQLTDHEAAIR